MVEKNRRPEEVPEPQEQRVPPRGEEQPDREQEGEDQTERNASAKISVEEHLAGLWCALGLGD